MSQEFCEREALIAVAARSGAWTSALEVHVATCIACAETKRVVQPFLALATSEPLAANLVWRRLQARRQQQAIRRATRFMATMCVLAGLYAVSLIAWFAPQLWRPKLAIDLSPLANGVVFGGVLAAVLAVFLGSCCFAFLGGRTDFLLRS